MHGGACRRLRGCDQPARFPSRHSVGQRTRYPRRRIELALRFRRCWAGGGERAGTRTPNLVIKSHLLYQLSYAPTAGFARLRGMDNRKCLSQDSTGLSTRRRRADSRSYLPTGGPGNDRSQMPG